MNNSLLKRYFHKFTSNIVALIAGLSITSIATRALGPLNYGNFSLLTDVFAQIFNFFEGGSSMAMATKSSQRPKELGLILFFSKLMLLIIFIVSISTFIVYLFGYTEYLLPNQDQELVLLALAYAILFWSSITLGKILDSLKLTIPFEKLKLIVSIIKLSIIAVFFATNNLSIYHFFHIQIFVLIVLNLGFIFFIFSYFNNVKEKTMSSTELYIKEFLDYCSPLIFYTLISSIALIFDRWILQKYGGSVEQGYFALSNKLSALCLIFTSSLVPLFHREVAVQVVTKNIEVMQKLIKKFLPLFYFIAAYFSIFSFFQSEKIVLLFAGDKFSEIPYVINFMFLYPVHQTYGQLVGSVYYASGETKLYRNVSGFFLIIGTFLTFFLLSSSDVGGLNLGATGLAIKYLAIQLLNTNILLFFILKGIELKFFPFIKNQILIILSLFLCAIISSYLASPLLSDNTILDFLVEGVVYTLIVILFIYISLKTNFNLFMDKNIIIKESITNYLNRKK